MNYSEIEMKELIGKTFTNVYTYGSGDGIVFANEEETYVLRHNQNCCEDVIIDDICGDLSSLENSPITFSERSTSNDNPKSEYDVSFTWTFFKFATVKGWVDIRFYGTSNGYYSEDANLYKG